MNAVKLIKITALLSGEITEITQILCLENASNCFLSNEVKVNLLKDARKIYPRIIIFLKLFDGVNLCNFTTRASCEVAKNNHISRLILQNFNVHVL